MKIMLGTFACFCIEARFGADVGTGVQVAARHYTRRLRSARKPVEIPRFLRDQPLDDARREFEVFIEPEVQEMLEREAGKRQVYLDQILSHAVFVYLADLDAAGMAGGGPTEEATTSTR
jgi:hypothetical protein